MLLIVFASLAAGASRSATTQPTTTSAEPPEPKRFTFSEKLPAQLTVHKSRSGHLLVPAKINGNDAGWFIFDSGAGMSCIDKQLAKKLDLVDVGEASAVGNGGVQKTRLRHVDSISIGPVLVEDLPVVELDLRMISLLIGHPVDGVIGYDCFLPAIYELDVQSSNITVHDPATYKLPEESEWYPLKLIGRRPYVAGRIEDCAEGLFMLDTGDPDMVIVDGPAVRDLKLLEGRDTHLSAFGGVGGMRASRSGILKTFTLCGQTRPCNTSAAIHGGGFLVDLKSIPWLKHCHPERSEIGMKACCPRAIAQ